jgi:hypothetical protein
VKAVLCHFGKDPTKQSRHHLVDDVVSKLPQK